MAVAARAELNPRLIPKPVMTNVITPPVKRASGSCLYIEPEPPIVTSQQKEEALKMWKDLLMETKDYKPFLHKPRDEHDKSIQFLSNAMKGFRESKLRGLKLLEWQHGPFGPLQTTMHIPKVFLCPISSLRKLNKIRRWCTISDAVRCLNSTSCCAWTLQDTSQALNPQRVRKIRL
jgi:hypothetical protein